MAALLLSLKVREHLERKHCRAGHDLAETGRTTPKGCYYCRLCAILYTQRWKQRNPEKVALQKQRRSQNVDDIWSRQRPTYIKRQYGLTIEQFEDLLKKQNDCCAICKASGWGTRTNVPHIDHDHSTGVVRGLLCRSCNTGLGNFKDNPEFLRQAAAYLERPQKA